MSGRGGPYNRRQYNDMEPRGRGRAYGRARGQTGQGQRPQQPRPGGFQQQRPGPSQETRPGPSREQRPGPPQQFPQQSAWSRAPKPAGPAWPRATPQQQTAAGRGARQGGDEVVSKAVETMSGAFSESVAIGNKEGGDSAARGGGNSVRGRSAYRQEILVTRPEQHLNSKKGTTGKPVTLQANFFALTSKINWCLQQYRVDFNPDVDETSKRKAYLRTAISGQNIVNGYLFDGTVLYTTVRIQPDPHELFVNTNSDEPVRITIKRVGDVTKGDYHNLQVFNIIVRKCLVLMGFQEIRRNYYDPRDRTVIDAHRLEIWNGYFTSMRQHEQYILLNIDMMFKILRTDSVLDFCSQSLQSNRKQDFQQQVIGTVVLTKYNNKTYVVDDVDFNTRVTDTFPKADGSRISYVDYYRQKYSLEIRNLHQPMLVSRSKAREIRAGMPELVYLVPELCVMTGLTERQRENFQLMKTLASSTRLDPRARCSKLKNFSRKLVGKPEVVQELRKWDMKLAEDLVTFNARVLPAQPIFSYGQDPVSNRGKSDWMADLRSRPMFFHGKMERLAVICPPLRRKDDLDNFLRTLRRACDGMNFNQGTVRTFPIPNDRAESYLYEIEQVAASFQPTLIITVLNSNSQDRYSAIKKKCCIDKGIPSQVVLSKQFMNKGLMSIATKIAVQLNCKIGGAPWTVSIPISNIMVVGYDVCRDTTNKKRCFAGYVASLNDNMTRYYSATYEHKVDEELSGNFAAFLILACERYSRWNNKYPDRILIYRDGVGEGQLPYVYEHEVVNIKTKLKEQIYKDAPLRLAFIVVSKRINVRVFHNEENPEPGTVIDDVITLPERYDFYIVSQCVRQGTVTPTSYNVIEDSFGLTPDRLQMLTYKLTHMYFNWTGGIRVPAPCQYAHKLAFLVSQSLQRSANARLDDVLFFL